jgi:hypothetical protein
MVYFIIIICVFIFSLFFVWSFEIFPSHLRVKYNPLLFFLKPKTYNIDDIGSVVIINISGKGMLPNILIKLKNNEIKIKHYYFLISTKSLNEMIATLSAMNVNASIVHSSADFILKRKNIY